MIQFKSKLNIQSPKEEPDTFFCDDDSNSKKIYPNENFIISRKSTGEPLSKYGDDYWDLSPYAMHSRAASKIYFKKFLTDENKSLINDYKWMMFVTIFIADSGRAGFLSVSTIYSYACKLSLIIKYCVSAKISIATLFSEEKELKKLFKLHKDSKTKLENILTIINNIKKIDKSIIGFEVIDSAKIPLKRMPIIKTQKQTVIIPARIFSEIISSCNNFLNEYIGVRYSFINFVKKSNENAAFARSKGRQKANSPGIINWEDDFKTACINFGLSHYMNRNKITDLHGISRHLRKIQYACKLLIHLYTGMRDDEVSRMKYDCLHIEKTLNGKVFRIVGETTKLVGLKKAERWVTSYEIEPAIEVAKEISKIIAEGLGVIGDDHILFLPVSNLVFSPSSKNSKNFSQSGFNDIKNTLFTIIIESGDIKELQKLTPNAEWLSESAFQVGSIWPISTHQFRRTLAVYAAQSGLVSLPSLKRQLKHITNEMTLYYAASSSFSNTLFGDDKMHFRHDFNESKLYGEGLGYVYNLLLSDRALYGVQGIWLEKHERKRDETQILAAREDTLKRFKRGELAYAVTPLGACLSREACDKKPMRAISACISCDNAVIVEEKLEKVIFYQNALLVGLNQESMEYRMEKEQLDDLSRLHIQIRRKNNVSTD